MRRTALISLLLLVLLKAGAQEQLSLKQQADKLYDRYEYFKALTYYQKLADKTNPKVYYVERVADCYRNMNRYDEAETWYGQAVTDPKASRVSHYYYAEVLLRNQRYELAKDQYKIYFVNDPGTLAIKLANCDSAAVWLKQSPAYEVNNQADLNTQYSDWGLNYDGDKGFLFTSDRVLDGGADMDNRTGNNWFKLYRLDAKSNQLQQLTISNETRENLQGNYHIGPMSLNSTADTAYITLTTEVSLYKLAVDKHVKSKQQLSTRRLELVMARRDRDGWVIFADFPYNNIQRYSVSSAALTKDGRVLYFASDMPGGLGKTDLWYCLKRANGTWDKPVNCGKTINTADDDNFPYVDDKGNLYNSSKGLAGMGGYDIYKAKGEKNNWTAPQNLKFPINSTSDDFYLVSNDGLTGYFSSNRENGQGSDDIYSFNKLIVYTPLIKKIKAPDGPQIVTTVPGVIKAMPGASPQSYHLSIIYYDLNKANIRPDAAVELDKLITILKQHPNFRVELSAYTDARASLKYNLALSKRRAASAANYLIVRGISPKRIVHKGYGKTNPVVKCPDGLNCTEAEHQLNRRTEFKIVK